MEISAVTKSLLPRNVDRKREKKFVINQPYTLI